MTDSQAPQPGAAQATSPSGQMEAQQPRPAPVPKARKGYAAAFGDASGAAVVFRDFASI